MAEYSCCSSVAFERPMKIHLHCTYPVQLFLLLWLSIPSGFLVVFERPYENTFTFTFTLYLPCPPPCVRLSPQAPSPLVPKVVTTTAVVLFLQLHLLVRRLFCGGRSAACTIAVKLLFVVAVLGLEIFLSGQAVFALFEVDTNVHALPLSVGAYGFPRPEPLMFGTEE
jgi:hypothetical protein